MSWGSPWAGAPTNHRPSRATWPPRPRPLKAKHARSARGASQTSVTLSQAAADPASARSPSSERTARKVRPPLSVFWRLPGVVEVGALLLPLSYFYPPVMPDPAHGGRFSRCRSRRRVRAARLLNRASTSGRTPAVCLQAPALHGPRLGTEPRRGRDRKEAAAGKLGIPRSHGYRSIPTFGLNNLTHQTGDSGCSCTETAYPSRKRAV